MNLRVKQYCFLMGITWSIAFGSITCSTQVVRRVNQLPPPPPQERFLHLKFTPSQIHIYIDDQFYGQLHHYPTQILLIPQKKRFTFDH